MISSGNTFFFEWEIRLMEMLQHALGDGPISFMSILSFFGEPGFMILCIGFFYWAYDKKIGKVLGINGLMVNVWSSMLKNVFMRRRPYFDNENIKVYSLPEKGADAYDIAAQGFSFPSMHSSSAVTIFTTLARQLEKRWLIVVAIVLSLVTGISRVLVGVHFPTDVLVGWGMGLVTIFLIDVLSGKIKSEPVFYMVLLLSGLPGVFYCKSADFFTGYGALVGFICALLYEEKYVHFENARKPLAFIVRITGGLAIFLVLNTLLKLPFSREFLESGSMAALIVRALRYAVIVFVDMGIYPMSFRWLDRVMKA